VHRVVQLGNELNSRSHDGKIVLSGIRIRPRLGVDALERSIPQDCEADITICGDYEAAASTDDLSKALDYTQVIEKVVDIANCREYCLLETLTYSITRGVLQAFPAGKVLVRVRKRPVTLAGKLDYVQVELEESW
jgi:7,8-dihydroneopterin aldolase/epimerase/oxygenase